MTASGFQKTGWHWTRKGWKRTPKHVQTVKKIAPVKKRRRKQTPAKAAERQRAPTFAEARRKAVEQGRAESAPNPPAEAAPPAQRPPRRAWSGKYDELDPQRRSKS